jgi:autophagy-related protein 16
MEPEWKRHFHSQLKPFHFAHFDLLNNFKINLVRSEKERLQLKLELEKERTENPKINQLESTLNQCKLELAESYKTNALNSQRLVSLIEKEATTAKEIGDLQAKIVEKDGFIQDLTKKYNENVQEISEKEKVLEILRDELQALQLELTKREEKWEVTEAENKELLDRWIKEKEKQIEKMNEANLYVERYRMIKECIKDKRHYGESCIFILCAKRR